MPISVLMPALSPTMTEGTLGKWLVKEGDSVASGDVIAEIETDKATMEVEAVDEGVIGKILVPDGTEEVAVNSVIALILEEGEDATSLTTVVESGEGESANQKNEKSENKEILKSSGIAEAEKASRNSSVDRDGSGDAGERKRISPLARRLARSASLDISSIRGTGPGGRVVAADVRMAQERQNKETANAVTLKGAGPGEKTAVNSGVDAQKIAEAFGLKHEIIPANKMRRTIAHRLSESKQTVPHFYLSVDIAIDELLALRQQINASLDSETGRKISVNDFVIKASSLSLMEVKAANASWNGDSVVQYENAHVSVAVAIEGGLITPVIRLAEQKTMSVISAEMKDLAHRAREGKLLLEEFQGGTFSISNLGMMGIREFMAVINPPESMILAVGTGEKRPVVLKTGELGVATLMTVTLSCDHRVVDGALGARWLQVFKNYMENPLRMLV